MNTSAKAQNLSFDQPTMWVDLDDGRALGIPLAWFPRLLHGTPDQRRQWALIGRGEGLHWEALDEDISVAGFLAGRGDQTRARIQAA